MEEKLQDLYDLLNLILYNDCPNADECSDTQNKMYYYIERLKVAMEDVYREYV